MQCRSLKNSLAIMPKRSASKSPASPPKKVRPSMQPEDLEIMVPEPHRKWPIDQVPVEIFQLICDFLPRPSVQCMRLVCREFDRMVSAHYFRNVVAPFRAALYGSPDNHSGALAVGSAGGEELRTVFHVFGEHIRAFALALELNEVDLAFPPEKLTQQVVKTPWGLYRWPLRDYQRYSDLEAIEDQADETALLTSSFRKLSQLSELGLSCDAGLGYLQGPDLNKYAPRTLPRVFKSARYEPEALTSHSMDGTVENGRARRYDQLQRMMVNAGYSAEEIPGAIDYLKTCEGRASPRKYTEDEGMMPIVDSSEVGYENAHVAPSDVLPRPEALLLDDGTDDEPLAEVDVNGAAVQNPVPPWFDINRWATKTTKQIKSNPLEPQDLTAAQREMLLEMSWAHDALVQSFVLSVTDNYDAFSNVMSFNIARIPAHLVHTLARPTFWDSLPNVWEFSLGVIPDWREVHKRNGVIEDQPLSPLDATGPTYRLLQAVASRKNIKKLHFEWICGGELGVGAGQRNRYVLPAPFVPDPRLMVKWDVLTNDATSHRVLQLPHITEMSLKNCWFSPHVFLHTVQFMSASSLTTLKLNTVSITGPVQRIVSVSYLPHNGGADRIPNAWPWPLCMGASPGRPYTFQENVAQVPNAVQPPVQWANAAPAPNVAQTTATASPPSSQAWQGPLRDHWVPIPEFLSWAHILNEITPGQTLLEKYHDLASDPFDQSEKRFQELQGRLKKLGKNLERTRKRGLHTIDFKSCGYILVDAEHINNHALIPSGPRNVAMLPSMIDKLRCLDGYMLKSTATLLGKIMDDFTEGEQNILRHAFDMSFGWTGVYEPEVEHAAHEDGFLEQGHCRFSGGWEKGEPRPLTLRMPPMSIPTHER
ncbi:hypothetical protein MGG_16243 [Pyricularia oryzae 70-15]|uniref:F-box domain-containing protein n=2 Tax=Pyricularia oryzae (strain 70-15 / ATCC MYA-4617 / FGSC 8958) TaxID=242507 RepID=G4MPR2_PYRO7|nr:uncharacterized protein MGG_16243 [Pyricularia oryzae 70-15]EHA57210.1 hypothetical protein MGG_16243 [Pyricularia oryzae 70-15]